MKRSTASAPIRVCDAGGWTDTWFAGHGLVVNVAAEPRAVATVALVDRGDGPQVHVAAPDVDSDYSFDLAAPPRRHPLLEEAIATIGVPDRSAIEVEVGCGAPPGAATGTSAAVTVALLAALDRAVAGGRRRPSEIARLAHEVETARLGWQSGIQDQLASAHGGVSAITVHGYPHASVTRLKLDARFIDQLDAALVVVYLGASHVSTDVHAAVIRSLEEEGPTSPRLERLRGCAALARDALVAHDVAAWARALSANTDAQSSLHPDIVGPEAAAVIDVARACGALGWKVNGAGGEGGSVSVVCPPAAPTVRTGLEQEIDRHPRWRRIPVRVSPAGLLVD